jgi:thioesterase domain-containing protein
VHDGDGETLLYLNLARRLSPEHRIYGIQPYSQDNHPILHTRISEMAAYYLEQIRTVQATGPYLLGGMCAGGVLSFEMAKQLQAQNQTVALVALIDAADVEAPHRSIASQRLDRFSATLSQTEQTKAYQRVFYILNKVRQKVVNLVAYETQKQVKKVQASTKVKLFRYFIDRKLPLPSWLQNLPVRMIYVFAEKQYVPEGRYDGEVVLLRAIQGDGTIEDEAYIERYTDPLLGWGKRATHVQVYDIPGGHSSMLQEPNVEVMAEKIQAYIDQVLAERSLANPEGNPTQDD